MKTTHATLKIRPDVTAVTEAFRRIRTVMESSAASLRCWVSGQAYLSARYANRESVVDTQEVVDARDEWYAFRDLYAQNYGRNP